MTNCRSFDYFFFRNTHILFFVSIIHRFFLWEWKLPTCSVNDQLLEVFIYTFSVEYRGPLKVHTYKVILDQFIESFDIDNVFFLQEIRLTRCSTLKLIGWSPQEYTTGSFRTKAQEQHWDDTRTGGYSGWIRKIIFQ